MDPAFSRPGERPTPFEEQLLANVAVEQPRTAKQLWLTLAKRLGLAEVMAVLDEFGDGHVWMPSRSGLVQDLWAQVRDAEIQRLVYAEGLSHRAVARQLNVSRATVKRVVHSRHGGEPREHGKQGR